MSRHPLKPAATRSTPSVSTVPSGRPLLDTYSHSHSPAWQNRPLARQSRSHAATLSYHSLAGPSCVGAGRRRSPRRASRGTLGISVSRMKQHWHE